jgi:hypothetical protein
MANETLFCDSNCVIDTVYLPIMSHPIKSLLYFPTKAVLSFALIPQINFCPSRSTRCPLQSLVLSPSPSAFLQ